MLIVGMFVLSASPAPAQEASPDEARPLAIPGPPSAPLTADDVDALRRYDEERLQLRGYRWTSGGTVIVYRGWWGWGGRYGLPWGPAGTYVIVNPAEEHRTWAVFQGSHRLTVPAYLEEVDDPGATGFQARIQRSRGTSQGLAAVGAAGLAAALVGGFGSRTAETYGDARDWGLVTNVGWLTASVGVVGSLVASANTVRLRYDFTSTQDFEDVERRVREHNEALRDELGLPREETVDSRRPYSP